MPGTPPRKTAPILLSRCQGAWHHHLDEEMLPVKHFDVLMHVGEAAEVEV
ncbi:MAG: hypothetical protein ACQEUD_07065 [Bacillota bacterium]